MTGQFEVNRFLAAMNVVDIAVHHVDSLRFSYSTLAAAAVRLIEHDLHSIITQIKFPLSLSFKTSQNTQIQNIYIYIKKYKNNKLIKQHIQQYIAK